MSKRALDTTDEASISRKRTQRIVERVVTPTEPLPLCKLSDEVRFRVRDL
jgi:hypothetical protein